ncbi:hypothetical protein SDJN03_19813, partial [Cucurbita argyrosperma subsp. sororia]
MSPRLVYPISQEMPNNNNSPKPIAPNPRSSGQASPPLTRFSAIAPPRSGGISRTQIQVTLQTIYEDESEDRMCRRRRRRRHCYDRKPSFSSAALSCFRPLRSLKCS